MSSSSGSKSEVPPSALSGFKDVPTRLRELQQMLDEKLVDPKQEPNIRCAMDLYRKGPLPGGTGPYTMFQDGKVITIKELHRYSPFWLEGVAQQLIRFDQRSPDVPAETGQTAKHLQDAEVEEHQQLARRVQYPYVFDNARGHQIQALMRLSPNLGGDGTAMRVLLLNDTGSTSQSVFQNDLPTLGFTPQYAGLGNMVPITTANGQVYQQFIWIQVQLVRADGTAVSDWIDEMGTISTAEPATMRLTGDLIRNHLYFATAPGNQYLYVAETAHGILSQLPKG